MPGQMPGQMPGAGLGEDPNAAAQVQGRVLRGFLVSYQINPLGDFWPLHSGRLLIGRSNSGEALDVPLADATISSRHAAFTVDPGGGPIQIEDTGSTNGTFVNDEHLGFNGRRELHDGDRVRFGGYTAIIKVITR
jgi:pSer/pThr/pTyr-binding forkhead associated (FHA) protein